MNWHDWHDWTLLYYALEWVIRVVMLVVVTNRRRGSPMAWLLIISFFPVPGLVLYLLIGENRLPRRRAERSRSASVRRRPPGGSAGRSP